MNETPVFMSASDIDKFISFQKYYDVFNELLEAKVFDIKTGSVVLDFNNKGELMDIKVNVTVFRRKK